MKHQRSDQTSEDGRRPTWPLPANSDAAPETRWAQLPLALLPLLLALSTVAIAQETTAEEEVRVAPPVADESFEETVNVRLVNVDVWVTDRSGNPVSNLTADDFELREDNRPVPITHFSEFAQGTEVKRPDGQSASGLEGSEPALPETAAGETRSEAAANSLWASGPRPEEQLSLVVYIDHENLTPLGRNRILPFLRAFLRSKLGPNDRVMLATYSGGPVEVVRPFTRDTRSIAQATLEMESFGGGRLRADSEREDILRDLNQDDARYNRSISMVRSYAQGVTRDVQMALDGLREVMNMMAGLPGRKALLYISNGLPMRSAEDLFRAIDERFEDPRGKWPNRSQFKPTVTDAENASFEIFLHDSKRFFEAASSLANANRVTFYAIEATGLRSSMSTSDLQFSRSISNTHTNNLQESLLHVAERTGGQAIVNTRNWEAGLNRIASDFGNRYSIGFTPSHGGTGRRYDLEVKLKKETRKSADQKLRLRYRGSYVDKPPAEEMRSGILAALTLGYESNPLGIQVEPIQGRNSQEVLPDGNVKASLLVLVPLSKVALIPGAQDHEGRLRLYAQVRDEEDNLSAIVEHAVPVQVETAELEQALGKSWPYILELVMQPGEQELAIGIRDMLGSGTSIVTRRITVGADRDNAYPERTQPRSTSAPPRNTPSPEQPAPLLRARQLLQKGKTQEAIEVLVAGASEATGTELAEIYLQRAIAHNRLAQFEQMAASARRALDASDDVRFTTRAYNFLGVALFDNPNRTIEELREAEQAFRKVIAVTAGRASLAPQYSLAQVLVAQGRVDEAIATGREILGNSPLSAVGDQARVLVCQHRPGPAGETSPLPDGDAVAEEIIFKVAAKPPQDAQQTEGTREVTLRVRIDQEGCVAGAEPKSKAAPSEARTQQGLTDAAIIATRKSVFRPATRGGVPVEVTRDITVTFDQP